MQVMVDDDFARFGSKSYAINKINSVEVREHRPNGETGAIVCAALSLIFVLIGFNQIGTPDSAAGTDFFVAAILAGLAFFLWQRSRMVEYQLFLMTSSSETQAFVTSNEAQVQALRDKIESAMVQHSRAAFGGAR